MSTKITSSTDAAAVTRLTGSTAMKELVEALAAKHGACFSRSGLAVNPKSSLTLTLGNGCLPLNIDVTGPNTVNVSKYYKETDGSLVALPDIAFFTNPQHADQNGWIPLDFSIGPFYFLVATLTTDYQKIEQVVMPDLLPELVGHVNRWAAELVERGWLDRAVED